MLHKKWPLLLVFIFLLIGALYFLPHKNKVEAVCRITCDGARRCSQICTELPPRIPTDTASTQCAADCPNGTICYQPPMPVCKAGTKCLQIMPPTRCVPQATTACSPLRIGCSNACGQTLKCTSDGCGSKTCCPATAACTSTGIPTPTSAFIPCNSNMICPSGLVCRLYDSSTGGTSSEAQYVCLPASECKKSCPLGLKCSLSPATCPQGIRCMGILQREECIPQCTLRSQGDANCDGAVNAADYDIFKSKMSGIAYTGVNYSADFNSDGKINVVDYEIWRNTFYK